MKNHKLLYFIALGFLLIACDKEKKSTESLFAVDASQLKEQYSATESVPFEILNSTNQKIDSTIFYSNEIKIGKTIDGKGINFNLTSQKLGYHTLKALVYSEGSTEEIEHRIEVLASLEPKLLSYTILNTYPHDTKAYTQGLEFYRDTLYEGTGRNGLSSLRKTDYKTGKVYKQVDLDSQYFGEGITIFNNKVYQLTWQSLVGFVYNADNLIKEKSFNYSRKIEGWGLTHDDKYLYQSDGTEKIWKLDPETLKDVDYINIYTNTSKIKAVNEMEWIDGKIYANIYQMDAIAIINPTTGAVEAVVNLSDLKNQVTQHPDLDVLNGIAYNPRTKTIFVTGKNWDKMFEITINN
jgi:glutamine cyclotransferase